MSEHYPRIRIQAESGQLLIREGLSITFYMRHSHAEVAPGVMRSLETYRRAVEPHALGVYADEDGYWQELDETGWGCIQDKLLDPLWASVHLADAVTSENRYRFEYLGKVLDAPALASKPGAVSAVSFWLPTEYLEANGPGWVRELALELAAPLPFCSGHAGLSFNCETDLLGVGRELRELCFRYPGMDIPHPSLHSLHIGTRIQGASWLTFLGQPVLGELGGPVGLRSRLRSPDTTVQEMEGSRAVVTLGPWPEAGDTEQGQVLPAYRELARVLEPWLYPRTPSRRLDFSPEDMLRWERRFLD